MAEELRIQVNYLRHKSWDVLDSLDVQLLRDAARAASLAYARYSDFRVGAALRMAGGRLVLGSNQENASFPAGCCAERTALYAAMVPDANGIVETIAVVAPSMPDKTVVTPCGVCRQVMVEQESRQGKPMRVILGAPGGAVLEFKSASHLLPLSFKGEFLSD